MYGQPNYYYQQPQQRNMDYLQQYAQVNTLKGRPVSSIEEVRAAQIDFDGSLFVFPDIANKCIYTKQISATGAAILNKYNLQEEAQPTFPTYVTKEEFENSITQLKNAIETKDALIAQLQAQVIQGQQSQPQPQLKETTKPIKETINF